MNPQYHAAEQLRQALAQIERQSLQENDELRSAIRIANNDDGTPVYQWVSAATQDELNDAIVNTYVQSGRIYEFLEVPKSGMQRPPVKQVCFKDYAQQWLKLYKSGLKGTSLKDYEYILSHYLYPAFGEQMLAEITTSDIQALFNQHATIARSTINKMEMYLEQILRSAQKDGLIRENPVDRERLLNPSRVQNKREALTTEEYLDILNHLHLLDPQDRRMLALMSYTGMRRGEVLGLRWEDIDFDAAEIHVQRNVVFITNSPTIDTPKSASGNRRIPLDSRLLEHLEPIGKQGFVVGGENPITKSSFTKAMKRIGKTIDLHDATAHILRHTYATTLHSAGVQPKIIQYLMGHADIGTTLNIYTHVKSEDVSAAGQRFAKLTTISRNDNSPTR